MTKTTLCPAFLFVFLLVNFIGLNTLTAQSELSDFPWLVDVLNEEDCCQNESVTAYSMGIYTFVYIKKGADCSVVEGELYFQDGTYYCMDINGMDCRSAYNLTEENATILWDCTGNSMQSDCENILQEKWLEGLTQSNCTGNIYQVQYNGAPAVYMQTLCGCIDATSVLYSCTGEELCANGFVSPDFVCDTEAITAQLTAENLIWTPECDCDCPVDFTPVCGVDGNTYDTACEAICAGVEIMDKAACQELQCTALDNIDIGENPCESCLGEISIYSYQGEEYVVRIENSPFCSDGLTTVINCDSTKAFCLNGGIAGFNQCEDFFKEATWIKNVWTRAENCGKGEVTYAEPCTDLAKVDFGLCLAVMGVGIVKGKCVTISGCLDPVIDGVDYSEALFPSVEICQQTCGLVSQEQPKVFEEYKWLSNIIDPNNCTNATIEVYDLGAFSYLYIQNDEKGMLYFQDGTLYCLDRSNYDCRSLYGLSAEQVTTTWICIDDDFASTKTTEFKSLKTSSLPSTTLKAFPNPTKGNVQFQLDTDTQYPQTIKIYDLHGRLIQQLDVQSTVLSIDLSHEQNGIYLVEWSNGI